MKKFLQFLLETIVRWFKFFLAKIWWGKQDPLEPKSSVSFLKSLLAFIRLSRAGFRISHSYLTNTNLEIFRFYWNNEVIRDMADIDYTGQGRYNSLLNGCVRPLSDRRVVK